MKKILFLAICFMAVNAHAMSNRDDFQRWRSSETGTTDKYVFLTSGCPCVIHDVTVTSGTNNSVSSFRYFGSTETVNKNLNISVSTSQFYDINTSGLRYDIDDVIGSSSTFYEKMSSSTIRIRWDYYISPPKGLEKKGLK